MFRSAPRLIARQSALRSPRPLPQRRFITTGPAPTRRSWKSLVARLGVAGAIVYYYNTTDFSEDPTYLAPVHSRGSTTETAQDELPTLESIAAERRQRRAVEMHLELQREKEEAQRAAREAREPGEGEDETQGSGTLASGPADLEAEADQQGAFNPETGEINWDCPCLGGMATGPCGDEFKAAFSCFVFSKEEPKGVDCIEKFKDMQGCFRQYPEVYGSEIDDDNDDDDMTADAAADVTVPEQSGAEPALSGDGSASGAEVEESATKQPTEEPATKQPTTKDAKQDTKAPTPAGPHSPSKVEQNRRELGLVPESYRPSESEPAVPKEASDAR